VQLVPFTQFNKFIVFVFVILCCNVACWGPGENRNEHACIVLLFVYFILEVRKVRTRG
jgi:hypothetical protein